jgi:hypothetical protein
MPLSTIFQYNMAVIIFKPNLYTRDILTVSLQFETELMVNLTIPSPGVCVSVTVTVSGTGSLPSEPPPCCNHSD